MMIQPMEQETKFEPAIAPSSGASSFRLRRTGHRPLSFEGTELGMAMSFVPGAAYWYEINIYRTTTQKFVLCVRNFFQSENERDTCQAWECESFFEVMDKLESYDAANDVRVNVDLEDTSLSLADLTAAAFSYRARAASARQQFEGLVGELLHELSLAG